MHTRPPVNAPLTTQYTYYHKYLYQIILHSKFTGRERALLEHFIDREQRDHGYPPRESEYKLEFLLKTNGTVRMDCCTGKYAKAYMELLWLYNLCAVIEFNPKMRKPAIHDLGELAKWVSTKTE